MKKAVILLVIGGLLMSFVPVTQAASASPAGCTVEGAYFQITGKTDKVCSSSFLKVINKVLAKVEIWLDDFFHDTTTEGPVEQPVPVEEEPPVIEESHGIEQPECEGDCNGDPTIENEWHRYHAVGGLFSVGFPGDWKLKVTDKNIWDLSKDGVVVRFHQVEAVDGETTDNVLKCQTDIPNLKLASCKYDDINGTEFKYRKFLAMKTLMPQNAYHRYATIKDGMKYRVAFFVPESKFYSELESEVFEIAKSMIVKDKKVVEKSAVKWGWKKSTTPQDVLNFINGVGPYEAPVAVQDIAYTQEGFFIYYRTDIKGTNDWKFKQALAPAFWESKGGHELCGDDDACMIYSDIFNLLNKKNGYTGDKPADAKVAINYDKGFVFYRGVDKKATWSWKRGSHGDSMHGMLNGDISKAVSSVSTTASMNDTEAVVFYRTDLDMETGWGWKVAHTLNDAHNFLNGYGSYGEPVKDAQIYGYTGKGGDYYYIHYKK